MRLCVWMRRLFFVTGGTPRWRGTSLYMRVGEGGRLTLFPSMRSLPISTLSTLSSSLLVLLKDLSFLSQQKIFSAFFFLCSPFWSRVPRRKKKIGSSSTTRRSVREGLVISIRDRLCYAIMLFLCLRFMLCSASFYAVWRLFCLIALYSALLSLFLLDFFDSEQTTIDDRLIVGRSVG